MKTAISLPDELFRAAERRARSLGISRSELYARALADLLQRDSGAAVTAALDRVYGAEGGKVDETLGELQRRALEREDW